MKEHFSVKVMIVRFGFRRFLVSLSISFCLLAVTGHAATAPAGPHTFAVSGGQFLLDGKPFQIISGEMHYPRIPRAYWRARLKMAKAMGLNAITTYVFWNVHEPRPGVYDFSGQNDVAEFVREAQQEGLYVLLRPGPYSCAEWDWGGYPSWLLKDHAIVVRSSDPKFMEPATRWLHRLGQELAPLQLANGGPILMVQVENEYGSFGDDHAYMEQIHHALVDSGFKTAVLYTADGPEQVPKGGLPELPAVINFGTGGAKDGFAMLHTLRPNGPSMTGEYWAGWFDHWGEKHQKTDGTKQAEELGWMLGQGYSASLYMFHGGTSFGWMNGANWSGGQYQPDVNSYDYDAVLDESGRPTAKYFAFRDVIAKATGVTPPPAPATPGTQSIAPFALEESASLWDNLPQPVVSRELKTMEDLDQAYGYILYRTTASADLNGPLVLDGLHDYAQVYVDGKFAGTLDRRLKQTTLPLQMAKGARLDILVENSGRINFSLQLRGERQGIVNSVSMAGTQLHDWRIYPLPMTNTSELHYRRDGCRAGPCFYRGSFNAASAGDAAADTFLDTKGLSKGFVWVNGRPLGRDWKIGPQRTLYLPGAWIKRDSNEVVVLDLMGSITPNLRGLDKPILDAPVEAGP
jgi:beta-galactosidase